MPDTKSDQNEFIISDIIVRKTGGVIDNGVAALLSLMKGLEGNKPVSSEVVEFVEANIGRSVRVIGTRYEGIIHSCNKAQTGFYPGSRFPVFVKITESSDPLFDAAIGAVFEYSLDQIHLI